ncbi:MAG: hypothetical protein R6V03_06200, partial [Kiritimatiellia bacterium]
SWDDVREIESYIEKNGVQNAVVVGGGLIGLKSMEGLVERGIHTTLVELADRVLKGRGVLGGTTWAGWGFQRDLLGFVIYPPAQANAATDEELREYPVFLRNPGDMLSSNIVPDTVNEILARGIPAMSPAAGVNKMATIPVEKNADLDSKDYKPNGWPRNHETYVDRWLHSDVKNMAYLYTYKVFKEIAEKGELK